MPPLVAAPQPEGPGARGTPIDDSVARYLDLPSLRDRALRSTWTISDHCRSRPGEQTHVLPFTYRFSRLADMFTVAAAGFTAEDTVEVRINRVHFSLGVPV